jgi:hypothetical protein
MSKTLFLIAVLLLLAVSGYEAAAVSKRVKDACRADYRAYCSAHEVGSEALRSCMRSVKHKLSKRCVRVLAEEGEASDADIRSYKSKNR